MSDLDTRLRELGDLVDGWLREALVLSPAAHRFGEMLEYHMGWRDAELQTLAVPAPAGKRLTSLCSTLRAASPRCSGAR